MKFVGNLFDTNVGERSIFSLHVDQKFNLIFQLKKYLKP